MRSIHASFPPVFCTYQRRSLSGGDTIFDCSGEGEQLLPANSYFLRKEFRRDFHWSLEEFVSAIRSNVATTSLVAQGLSCFCPEIVIALDYYSFYHLFRQLLNGTLGPKWVKGSDTEAAEAKFHSFARELREM